MFGVLLESRVGRPRRTGGAVLSVALHVAIIGAAVVGTVHGKAAPSDRAKVVPLVFAVKPAITPVTRSRANVAASRPSLPVNLTIRHVDVPNFAPTTLPANIPAAGAPTDSIVIGGPTTPGGIGGGMAKVFFADERPGRDWNVHDALMNLVKTATPKYPEALRAAGVEGSVLVLFAVDTLGRVDMASVKILRSTHDLFTDAARAALKDFRFRPAIVEGHRVVALAQMPFDFRLTK